MAPPLDELRQYLTGSGGRLYVGSVPGGLALARPQHSALVLGPPRSGKTTALAVPNVLCAPGPVIVTSTKADLMAATVGYRSGVGRCWLLDPTGAVRPPEGVTAIRWSPVAAAGEWDGALLAARALASAARPGAGRGESAHWTERAEALLAPLLHAAHLEDRGMDAVLGWVLRQKTSDASAALRLAGAGVGVDVLAGIDATDSREQSGIFSSAAGILAAYRSEAVLDRSGPVNFDPTSLIDSCDTVYVCAPARHQDLVAPVVVAFLDQARTGCYRAWADGGPGRAPLTLVLDEMANIAPLHDLPSLVSEGGSQGILTLGCLQDLAQARDRWGPVADGFLSLFGAKLVLPGIADMRTLDLVSRLGGEVDVPSRSVSRGPWWAPGRGVPTVTWGTRRQRRVPVEAVRDQPAHGALLLSGADPPTPVELPPWWAIRAMAGAGPAERGLARVREP